MIDFKFAVKEVLKKRRAEAVIEAARNLVLGMTLIARASTARKVHIRSYPRRYQGLRQKKTPMLVRAQYALAAAKSFAAVAAVADKALEQL